MLKTYIKLCNKTSNIMEKGFNTDPAYCREDLEMKIKCYHVIHFHSNKIPKRGSHCFCLPVILIDSGFKICKYSSPQKTMKISIKSQYVRNFLEEEKI